MTVDNETSTEGIEVPQAWSLQQTSCVDHERYDELNQYLDGLVRYGTDELHKLAAEIAGGARPGIREVAARMALSGLPVASLAPEVINRWISLQATECKLVSVGQEA